jgi:hypothetical protein
MAKKSQNQKTRQPTFVEAYLGAFAERNPHVQIRMEDGVIIFEKPWGAENVSLSCESNDHTFLAELNHTWFNPIFDAVIHTDSNSIEFLFMYVDPTVESHASYMDRHFTFHFRGNSFTCRYKTPTTRFLEIARRSQNVPTDDVARTARQLPAFRDGQRISELQPRAQRYFKGRVPRNFIVQCPCDVATIDLVDFARHLNFAAEYYDRDAPLIVVRESTVSDDIGEQSSPCRFIEERFPEEMSIAPIDEVVMQLNEVARSSGSARMSFLYFYQVLEYSGHYFADDKVRSQLKKFLRCPSVVNCDDRRIGELFSLLTDINQNDDQKMRRMIEEVVDPAVIWREVENDRAFFSAQLQFDGGFSLAPLISKDATLDAWCTSWSPKLFDNLTRIRNCLVHAREKRENRVIFPTTRNNRRIARYLPLIARIAQQVAIASRGV